MATDDKKAMRTIMDREKMMSNPEGCPACGRKWNMGEPVVYACGSWGNDLKLIHESDAVFDTNTKTYVERKCFEAGKFGP